MRVRGGSAQSSSRAIELQPPCHALDRFALRSCAATGARRANLFTNRVASARLPPRDERARRRALVLLALCGALWSSAGVLIKLIDWPPGAIWSARCAIAAATLYAFGRPSLSGIAPAEWGAAVAFAATTGLFIAANKLTTPANAILIQYSAPVWVALLGPWFVGERVTRLDWLAIAVVLCGIALFFLEDLTFDHALGNVVALAAG